jgi:molybdate transport system substrate-binding protein
MRRRALLRSLMLLAAIGSLAADPAPEVTVYAAASLRDALEAIAPVCETRAQVHLVFNFGASNDLARQIVAANKADVFFSADEAWMDRVAQEGLVDASSRRSLLGNRLVVVVPNGSGLSIPDAAALGSQSVKRLALANPDAVPAGKYAKAWLEKVGLWETVRERVVPFPDVRATLAAVEAGAVDAGVVYRTDAAIAAGASVAFEVPAADGPQIRYPVAALAQRPAFEAARRTVACFEGREARALFEKRGFLVREASK